MNLKLALVGAVVAAALSVVAPASAADTCAVKAQGPRLTGKGKLAVLSGEFLNTCRRPMAQMGAYACLEELDYPEAPPRVIDCAASRVLATRANAIVAVKLRAKCDYTTIRRWYRISGYGWAHFTPADGGTPAKSPRQRTPAQSFWSADSARYCHISKGGVTWAK